MHMSFFKYELGVSRKTPNVAVLGDLGRYPIHIYCQVKQIKYWLKLVKEREESILGACYSRLLNECENGKENWATSVKQLLQEHGYGMVWLNQGVEDNRHFIVEFEQRLKDSFIQKWYQEKETNNKLRYYNMFKTEFKQELYISLNIPRKYITSCARYRMASHKLEVEIGRHHNVVYSDRLCRLCGRNKNKTVVECEYHFLFECDLYEPLREQFLQRNRIGYRTLYDFVGIMKNSDEQIIVSLCKFIYYAFRCRNDNL